MFAPTSGLFLIGPGVNGLFVIVKHVKQRRVLHENGFEGWNVERCLVWEDLKTPLTKELFESLIEVWAE